MRTYLNCPSPNLLLTPASVQDRRGPAPGWGTCEDGGPADVQCPGAAAPPAVFQDVLVLKPLGLTP